jgi:hypothetical protein
MGSITAEQVRQLVLALVSNGTDIHSIPLGSLVLAIRLTG